MAEACLRPGVDRILWVEASEHDRMFIQAILGQLPGRPRTEFVACVDELVDRLDGGAPDLVVLDLAPQGSDVATALARLPGPPPIVVFTSVEDEAVLAACAGLGAKVLRKPSDYRHFREAVGAIARDLLRPRPGQPLALATPA